MDAKDKFGFTALAHAVNCGNEAAAKMLCEKFGASVHAKDLAGNTILHLATARGVLRLVSIIVDAGADIGAINDNASTVLHKAAANPGRDLDPHSFIIRS